jgi:hypothetical protein
MNVQRILVLKMSRASLRAFTHATTAYYLSVTEVSGGSLQLALCNGESAWSGTLYAEQLTPPKRGVVSTDVFRDRLVCGLSGEQQRDELAVVRREGAAVELRWAATMPDVDLGIDMRLQQVIPLKGDLLPGEGLRALLGEVVRECDGLQRACVKHMRDTTAAQVSPSRQGCTTCALAQRVLAQQARRMPPPIVRPVCFDNPHSSLPALPLLCQEQLAELDSVVASRLGQARSSMQETNRETFAALLNRKKRRIKMLDDALERFDQGDDDDDTGSRRGSGDEEESENEEHPQQIQQSAHVAEEAKGSHSAPAPEAVGATFPSATPTAAAPPPADVDDDDLFVLL